MHKMDSQKEMCFAQVIKYQSENISFGQEEM